MKTTIVIFGITGDLAGRKLLPALDAIVEAGAHSDLSIIGISRRDVNTDELLKDHPLLRPRTTIYTMNLAEVDAYLDLKKHLEKDTADSVLFYLAVPPGAATGIVDFIGEAGLTSPRYRVLFEKPFGYDLVSAEEFIQRTWRYFHETQLYRIDHYMAKEIAAEVLKIRRNAESYHYHWSNKSVKSVTIVAAEKIGIEGRGQFYEQTGALRDLVQGHLLQLLSLILITKPGSGESLPIERLTTLQRLKPADPAKAVRGQYDGYQEEVGNLGSRVETFVSLELESDDPDWQGVPLRLITGKALDKKTTSIHVEYKDGTIDVFEEGKVLPTGARSLDAYERVLLEAMAGNEDIFTTSEEVLRSWEIIAPLQEAWGMSDEPPLLYTPGMSINDKMLQ